MKWPAFLYRLNDPLDRWWAPDKYGQHLPWAMVGTALVGFWGTQIVGLLVEALEAWRWMRLPVAERAALRRGEPGHRWPPLADLASLKDVCWNAAGGAVMHVALIVAHWFGDVVRAWS